MPDYDGFSSSYDELTGDVPYDTLTEWLINLFETYDKVPSLMLDLACGTGNFSYRFANKGIDVIGVDPSAGMLAKAMQKLPTGSDNPLFLNQSAQDLELFGTVDGAICMLDSLNHITSESELLTAFKRVSLFLEPERLFIFDMNTVYKHKTVLADKTYIKESEDCFCVWQNECDNERVNVYLDLFERQPNGLYKRSFEEFSEQAYSTSKIKDLLTQSGFKAEKTFDCRTGQEVTETTQRILIVARKL